MADRRVVVERAARHGMLPPMSTSVSVVTVQPIYSTEETVGNGSAVLVISDGTSEIHLATDEFMAIVDAVFSVFGDEEDEPEPEPEPNRRLVVRATTHQDAE